MKSVGEEYQVVTREILWLWGRIHGKKGKAKQYHFPYYIEGVGKNIKLGREEEYENLWEENQDLKIWGWGRRSSCTELYTPLEIGSWILTLPS